jgi:CheY-like chemotaxis protein
VHGLVSQSGGGLRIHSRKGEGTRIELWLPAAIGLTPGAPAPAAESSAGTAEDRPLSILAVDDDGLVLMNTVAMLEDMGHRVFEAVSGAEALEILRREGDIELVITDHAMPRMTGSQLAEVIRGEWPGLPMILATGYAELPPGGDNSLPKLAKPFGERELAKAIAALVEAGKLPSDPVAAAD